MKQLLIVLLSLSLSFTALAQETWTVDNAHSNLRFEVGWEDFSMRTGEFKVFDGTIVTDFNDDLTGAVIEFKVDAASVDLIADRLEDHAKSDKFLEVEKFPEITFTSSEVTKSSDNTYLSKGKLTIHGVEKDQEVTVLLKGSKETKRGYIYGLEVTLVVNRNDFGLDWGTPRLAEEIKMVGHLIYKLQEDEEKKE